MTGVKEEICGFRSYKETKQSKIPNHWRLERSRELSVSTQWGRLKAVRETKSPGRCVTVIPMFYISLCQAIHTWIPNSLTNVHLKERIWVSDLRVTSHGNRGGRVWSLDAVVKEQRRDKKIEVWCSPTLIWKKLANIQCEQGSWVTLGEWVVLAGSAEVPACVNHHCNDRYQGSIFTRVH